MVLYVSLRSFFSMTPNVHHWFGHQCWTETRFLCLLWTFIVYLPDIFGISGDELNYLRTDGADGFEVEADTIGPVLRLHYYLYANQRSQNRITKYFDVIFDLHNTMSISNRYIIFTWRKLTRCFLQVKIMYVTLLSTWKPNQRPHGQQ